MSTFALTHSRRKKIGGTGWGSVSIATLTQKLMSTCPPVRLRAFEATGKRAGECVYRTLCHDNHLSTCPPVHLGGDPAAEPKRTGKRAGECVYRTLYHDNLDKVDKVAVHAGPSEENNR
jgi:hypothetical protein